MLKRKNANSGSSENSQGRATAIGLSICVGLLSTYFVGYFLGSALASVLEIDVNRSLLGQPGGGAFLATYAAIMLGTFLIPYFATCYVVLKVIRMINRDKAKSGMSDE